MSSTDCLFEHLISIPGPNSGSPDGYNWLTLKISPKDFYWKKNNKKNQILLKKKNNSRLQEIIITKHAKSLSRARIYWKQDKWAATWDVQQCGICDQQSLPQISLRAVWSEPLLVDDGPLLLVFGSPHPSSANKTSEFDPLWQIFWVRSWKHTKGTANRAKITPAKAIAHEEMSQSRITAQPTVPWERDTEH